MVKIKPQPTFDEEKILWKKGIDFVIGVDEVGRGAFAGPVTAGAVVFSEKVAPCTRCNLYEINDSKLLTASKRKQLSFEIKKHALYWSVATIGVSVINKKGVGQATEMAFRKVLRQAQDKLQNNKMFILIDGYHVKYIRGIGLRNQKAIKKGDQKSISIAAASILAKVYRDNYMKRLHKKFPVYNFDKNKGYGTKEHQLAIKRYGLIETHRTSFALQKFTASK